ncbi:DUF551 domain-containing protein [Salmonella enterica]|nr:DUF551 domain-containing protein [Salmonella enterica]ECE0789547.1 DUF551 domain-containing protein [Salmonella enterica subsp. diarizonae]EEK9101536.1 DUF551 domain-containing protein [Salmonella enterica]EEP0418733.1 DUF551 domain-containing protein [Salmonella enterica]EFB0172684.1 DUF551 domain-containing protein [Salmonella enterica]
MKSFITGFLSDPAHDNQSSDSLLANVFRIALASLEAEPVAWKATFTQIDHEYNTFTAMYSDKAEAERWVRLHKVGDFRAEITPLYAAPPAPVIPDGWISCSERMPEDEQEVIVHNKLGYRYVSYFDEHSGLFFDMRGGNQMNCIEHILITHWMPLPAPPQK